MPSWNIVILLFTENQTEVYRENGYKLNTTTSFRQASYAAIHTDYVDRLDSSSNREYNESGYDSTKPMEELSSYVGISGLGLTLGLKYSL
jgi:hypothetical protein